MSMARLDEYEAEQHNIHAALGKLGREIATIRGDDSRSWEFHSYERTTADGWAIKDYPKGTRLIKVTYRIPQRYEPDYVSIMFPESYLDTDWHAIETEKVSAARTEAAEQKRIATEAAATAREERQRAEYARLKTLYGDA
jgi:hypothetical protein